MRTVVPQPYPEPAARDAESFGKAVRAARTGASIRLQDAAAALGISRQTLADIESGKGTVALGTALKVARELGVGVLTLPMACQFDVTRMLREARRLRPQDWGGHDPQDLPPDFNPTSKPRRKASSK